MFLPGIRVIDERQFLLPSKNAKADKYPILQCFALSTSASGAFMKCSAVDF